jgi:hypothetical protein
MIFLLLYLYSWAWNIVKLLQNLKSLVKSENFWRYGNAVLAQARK